ncbi:hypothetical protein GCM10023085_44550 [Actinomadura viridis]|uniref:C2H2-type domain-containing protein n=1 Tax=Actinomadura viridis TaxID=58110 RepID=A0A931DJP1_9ACTN|nr:hypothetical protein [Actinomadura viridis]MBG6089818.1 hypothetical protein [Actinomadura viridis]
MNIPACVYVPRPSAANFNIGINQGIWGWRTSALDRAGARAVAQSLQVGDYLLFGHRGPSSRVAANGWASATLVRIVVARITQPWYIASTQVWPDDVYPERVRMEILDDRDHVQGTSLTPDVMEALRMSANKQGVPVLAGQGALLQIAEQATTDTDQDDEGAGPAGVLDVDGPTDAVRTALVRKEQKRIRKHLFAGKTVAACSLCGRTFPLRLLVAAHIKRRADATHEERRTMANIMPACVMGCDALFEYGFVHVDTDGVIRVSVPAEAPVDLVAAASLLEGRLCAAFGEESRGFFDHHRSKALAPAGS